MLSLYFLGKDGEERPTLESVELLRAHAIESFDTGVVLARTSSGVRLWFGATHASHQALEPEIQVEGSEGQAWWRYENEAGWENRNGSHASQRMLDITGARGSMFQAALRRLTDPATYICSSGLALRHTQLIEAIHRAAEIRSVPPERLKWSEATDEKAQVPEIRDLPETLLRAYREQSSLAEAARGTGARVT